MPDITLSRRALLTAAAAGAFAPFLAAAATQELHDEPWLVRSFLDLREDFANAGKAGKNMALLWEMPGCPYCKQLHNVNFKDPAISAYIPPNFEVVQLDLTGMREVTDFDGEMLPEKFLAVKHNIRSTPTLQFFPVGGVRRAKELGRVGYIKAEEFFLMLRFVREKAYEKSSFDEWMKTAR
jgi:thioredoxin-related protein